MNLVTGASGILGSFVLAELVKQGKRVVPCKQQNSSLDGVKQVFQLYFENNEEKFNSLQWRDLDVLNLGSIEAALEDVTAVYHCAGLVSFKSSQRRRLFQVNEQGTANLVNMCLQKPEIIFCHVSSIITLNNKDYKGPLDEQVYWKSNGHESDYALSKYNGEREVWRGMEEGLQAVIVNPGLILAPGFWQQSSANLLHLLYKGNRFYTKGIVAPVMVMDVARIMILLMNQKHFGKRFIIVENNYSYKQFFEFIRKGFAYKGRLFPIPENLMKWLAFLERILSFFIGRDPRFTPAFLRSLHNKQSYSNESIVKTLNYSFEPLESGIHGLCSRYVAAAKQPSTKPLGSEA